MIIKLSIVILLVAATVHCQYSKGRFEQQTDGSQSQQRPNVDGDGSDGNSVEAGPEPPAVIPQTSFICEDKPYPLGMYADLETGCTVYHMCFDGRKESFLCGTGTVFNQEILSCDHPQNVVCEDSPKYYDANTELGKSVPEPGGGGQQPQRPRPQPGGQRPQGPAAPRPDFERPQRPVRPVEPDFGGPKEPDYERPVQPSRPFQPSGPSRPVQPSGPSRPFQPSGPSKPFQPSGPSRPFQPSGPSKPFQPSGPSRPFQPSGPSKPFQPSGPSRPFQPSGPSRPFQPSGPSRPVGPGSGKPSPGKPSKPRPPPSGRPLPPTAVRPRPSPVEPQRPIVQTSDDPNLDYEPSALTYVQQRPDASYRRAFFSRPARQWRLMSDSYA